MNKFTFLLIVLCALSFSELIAQENDAFKAPIITDEMTVDAEQNKDWREGNYKYSAKPKNMWEVGLHAGHYAINGDVPTTLPAGFGLGLHLRKAFNYNFSLRFDGMYFSTSGLDGRISRAAVLNLDNRGINLPADYRTYRAYKSTGITGGVEVLYNIGNILFHKERNKWNIYVGIGLALTGVSTDLDFLNGTSEYDWSSVESRFLSNTSDKRSAINDILDGDYETESVNGNNVPFFGGDGDGYLSYTGVLGVSRKLSKRINLSLEHKVYVQDNDKLDGALYRVVNANTGDTDQTNDNDYKNYTSLRLGINLGSFDNRTEPLYWLNPLDATLNDISALKLRPILDLTDTDGDGVIDMLDQEVTDTGCPVDTRGISLDSDGDGFVDCVDKEVYSPRGFEIDGEGVHVAVAGPVYLTEPEISDMISSRLAALPSADLEWFLPMIHFDLDKYYIRPEYHGQLHHVATVMKSHPGLRVAAHGHTDNRMPNDYNSVLSYKRAKAAIDYLVANYGISRDRLVLRYGGENSPLIGGLNDNHSISKNEEVQQYMNRRVEFKVAGGGDTEMGRPAGPDAGDNTPSSSRAGSKYSGNRNSGY